MTNTRIAKFYSDYATVWAVRISFPSGATELPPSITSTPASGQRSYLDPLRLA